MTHQTTPIVIGRVDGTHPPEVAGDFVTSNNARYRKWVLTVWSCAEWTADEFYMAVAAANNQISAASFPPNVMAIYDTIMADGINAYFKNWNVCICAETSPTTHRVHLHVTVESSTVISRKKLFEVFGNCWCAPMRGSKKAARDYVIKDGAMAIYIGNAATWDDNEQPLARQAPIDWQHVFACCNTVRTFKAFKRRYLDTNDTDCVRATICKVPLIKELITANGPPMKTLSLLLTLWQRGIVTQCLLNPILGHRTATWVWSSESGTGKTSIIDILIQNNLEVFIYPQDTPLKDALGMYNDEPVVVLDIPRDGRVDMMYPILEQITDQSLLSSGKYQGTITRFLAHTIVLSNTAPDHDRLPGRIQEVRVKPLADEEYEMTDIVTQLSFDD
jgi:hypothetical protein